MCRGKSWGIASGLENYLVVSDGREGHEGRKTFRNNVGLMLKLKLQCFGHLMQRSDPLEKTLMLGRIGGRRRRGQLPGASVRNSTRDKVMRQSSDGKANQTSGFPPGIS